MAESALLASGITPASESRARKTFRIVGWSGLALFLLVLFTVLKLPEVRLKNYIQGSISAALGNYGVTYTAAQSKIGMLFGISYTMKDITLSPPPPDAPTHIDEIEVSPSLLSLLTGKLGGKLYLQQGDGVLKSSFSARGSEASVSFKAKGLNLGKLGILSIFAGIKGTATITGEGTFSGDLSNPASWAGDATLELSKIATEAQMVQGFNLPALSASEGKIELSCDKGKALIKSAKIGKKGDDLVATASGDINLNKRLEASQLNLKTYFAVSERARKSFSGFDLLESFLAPAKQSDGGYAYQLLGPIEAVAPTPLGGGAGAPK